MNFIKKVYAFAIGSVLLFGGAGVAFATTPQDMQVVVDNDIGPATTLTPGLPNPGDGLCYFLGFEPSNHNPSMIAGNSGITCDGNVFNVDNIDQTHVTGLSTSLNNIRTSISTNAIYLASATSTLATLSATVAALSFNSITAFLGNNASTTPYIATTSQNGLMASTSVSKMNTIGTAYEGTTLRTGAFPIFKSATVGSGIAVFNLTADGTSGGTALCTNGVIQDSVQYVVNDATAAYQMGWAFTNSNKTLTFTSNKLSTANILTGILGQVAANGAVVKLTVWCY